MWLWGFPRKPGPPVWCRGLDVPDPACAPSLPCCLTSESPRGHCAQNNTSPPKNAVILLTKPWQHSCSQDAPSALAQDLQKSPKAIKQTRALCKGWLSPRTLPEPRGSLGSAPALSRTQGWDHTVPGAPMGGWAASPRKLTSPRTHHEPDRWKLENHPGNPARAGDCASPVPADGMSFRSRDLLLLIALLLFMCLLQC